MQIVTKTLILLWFWSCLVACAAQRSTVLGFGPPALSTGSAPPATFQTQPAFRQVGFHHFPAHRHVVFIHSGFWWGYPYYGYPVAYYYGEAYEKVGKQWGKELRKGQVTVDQFVTYLQYDLLRASDAARSSFQVGFLKGYGKNGLSLFTRALSQARESLPTPSASAPSPPPSLAPLEQPPKQGPMVAPKYQ